MTTRTVERQRTKCGQYWPDNVNHEPLNIAFSPYVINLLSEDKVGFEEESLKKGMILHSFAPIFALDRTKPSSI